MSHHPEPSNARHGKCLLPRVKGTRDPRVFSRRTLLHESAKVAKRPDSTAGKGYVKIDTCVFQSEDPPDATIRRIVRVVGLSTLLFAGCHTFRGGTELAISGRSPTGLSPAKLFTPSHDREWSLDLAVLPFADIADDHITLHNVRNCAYESDDDYVVNYYDRRYNLQQLQTVDFIVVPFVETPSLAHTMLSFGFADGKYVTVSAEARLEEHETYSPILGELRQYELIYVVADERDAILRRTKHRGVDVYVYRTIATPKQARELFLDVVHRVNELAEVPEFYDTLRNNCTTNIVRHLNQIRPTRIPYDIRVLLPGFSDGMAYELGLLDASLPFAETRRRARVTDIANRSAGAADFSQRIRR